MALPLHFPRFPFPSPVPPHSTRISHTLRTPSLVSPFSSFPLPSPPISQATYHHHLLDRHSSSIPLHVPLRHRDPALSGERRSELASMSANPYAHYDNQGVAGGVAGAAGTSAYPDSAAPNTPAAAGAGGGAMGYLSKLGKQAESVAGSFWGHMRTSNSLPDAAIGRISHGTRLLREGGFEGVYKQTFGAFASNEHLKKTYACHLSTSNGAVGGTLYITNLKFAFCSDRELTYYPTPGQTANSYYKVILPLEKVREVIPVANAKKPNDKYIQVVTKDGHEFWYMGFVNYDKGIKNMQEAVRLAQSQGNLSGGAMPGGVAPYGPTSTPSEPLYPPPAPTDRPGYGPPASDAHPFQPPPAGYPPAAKPGYPPA